jgi:hypothetical protein
MPQPDTISERLNEGDEAIATMPITQKPITTNEVHSFIIGTWVGIFLSVIFTFGITTVASIGVVLFLLLSLFDPPYSSIGGTTISHEPWWFLPPFTTSFIVVLILI